LHNYDIIITTFSILAQEWKSKRDPLHGVDFYRLVLDEAHAIRNAKTNCSKAVCALAAERRWAVTATPLQNRLNDIATLFKFLKYKPFDTKAGFHNHIFAAQAGGNTGMDNLRSALQTICLRRAKEIIASKLPLRTEQIRFLDFSPNEKELYDLQKQNLSRVKSRTRNGAEALRYLSRLRMICGHGYDLLPVERNPGSFSPGSIMTCIVCQQPLEGPIRGEAMGCPQCCISAHAECMELLPRTDTSFECEKCASSEPITLEAESVMVESPFPQYKGPSTKVLALLQAIRSDCSANYPWPKQ
jgi:SWI/SNF-related matrix-associated actin-dependent regulator of chromatin subfamily A3